MCVVALAHRAHSHWRLVVAGNRDELHARASAPLARWEYGDIIAGRDLVSGGSWLGIAEAGRFAVVTNLAGLGDPDPACRSRGDLVTRALAGEFPAENELGNYNPFCLLSIDDDGGRLSLNRPQSVSQPIAPGVYSLSNTLPGFVWPRREALEQAMRDWLAGDADDPRLLFTHLSDESLAAQDERPIFIRDPIYGTRCSSIVAVDVDGSGVIIERRFGPEGTIEGENEFAFKWR